MPYLPPHLRNRAAQASLQGVDLYTWRTKLEHPADINVVFDGCPGHVGEDSIVEDGVIVHYVDFPSTAPIYELADFIKWFKDSAGTDDRIRLVFPPTLSKEDRKLVHSQAQLLGLQSESHGIGSDRFICICPRDPNAEEPIGADGSHFGEQAGHEETRKGRQWSPEVRNAARRLWAWCQAEGGGFLEYSHGELRELVASGQPMPDNLARMCAKRENGQQLIGLLKSGNVSEALSLIAQHPEAVWVRDEAHISNPQHPYTDAVLDPGVAAHDSSTGHITPRTHGGNQPVRAQAVSALTPALRESQNKAAKGEERPRKQSGTLDESAAGQAGLERGEGAVIEASQHAVEANGSSLTPAMEALSLTGGMVGEAGIEAAPESVSRKDSPAHSPLPDSVLDGAAGSHLGNSRQRRRSRRNSVNAPAPAATDHPLDFPDEGYPMHIAAYYGLTQVVAELARLPGVIEQRDHRYRTPIQVARSRGHPAIVDILRGAGAQDYDQSHSPAHHGHGHAYHPPGSDPDTPPRFRHSSAHTQSHHGLEGHTSTPHSGRHSSVHTTAHHGFEERATALHGGRHTPHGHGHGHEHTRPQGEDHGVGHHSRKAVVAQGPPVQGADGHEDDGKHGKKGGGKGLKPKTEAQAAKGPKQDAKKVGKSEKEDEEEGVREEDEHEEGMEDGTGGEGAKKKKPKRKKKNTNERRRSLDSQLNSASEGKSGGGEHRAVVKAGAGKGGKGVATPKSAERGHTEGLGAHVPPAHHVNRSNVDSWRRQSHGDEEAGESSDGHMHDHPHHGTRVTTEHGSHAIAIKPPLHPSSGGHGTMGHSSAPTRGGSSEICSISPAHRMSKSPISMSPPPHARSGHGSYERGSDGGGRSPLSSSPSTARGHVHHALNKSPLAAPFVTHAKDPPTQSAPAVTSIGFTFGRGRGTALPGTTVNPLAPGSAVSRTLGESEGDNVVH